MAYIGNRRSLITRPPVTTIASFLPSDVSGLFAWHDVPFEAYADNDPIGLVTDRSAHSNTLTAALAARPINKTGIKNSLAVARTDAVSRYFNTSFNFNGVATNNAFTIYLVASITVGTDSATIANNDALFSGQAGTGTSFGLFFRTSNGATAQVIDNSSVTSTANIAYSSGTWTIWTVKLNGTTFSLRKNNGSPVTATLTDVVHATTMSNKLYLLSGSVAYTAGDLGEVLFYDSAISGTNDTNILSYLNTRWAVY